MRCEYCGSDLVEVDNPMRREFRHRRGVVCSGRPAPEFREPAGDLNTAQDVQEFPAPSTTDRLAEIRANHKRAADYDGDENGFDSTIEYCEWCGNDEWPCNEAFLIDLLDSLRARLDTAEGRLAKLRARHRLDDELACGNGEHTNRSVICPECADVCAGCGDYWPCEDAKDLGVDDE